MLSPSDSSPVLSPGTADLVKKSAVFYGSSSCIGLGVMWVFHKSLPGAVGAPLSFEEGLRWGAVGALAALVLLVLSHFFEDWFTSFRELKSVIVQLLGPVSVPVALYLALVSSIGEELLFRGAIQPFAGLWITAILFGVLHMGPGALSTWSLWAALAGLLLGWIFEATGSLWPPIIAHFIVNTVSILSVRRTWQGMQEHVVASDSSITDPKTRHEKTPQVKPAKRQETPRDD